MWLRSDFHPWREKRLAIFPCDMSQADCTNSTARFCILCLSQLCSAVPPVSEAEPCAPHSSASCVSVSPERPSRRGLWWKSGGLHTTDQNPWMKVQGAWSPSGQAISDMHFLLGFCVSLRIWAAVGESSPSLISLLSRAVGADAEDTGGPG